jgi:hypothetical protein
MRWGLLSVRIGILVVSIVTTILLLLAVVPLATGGLEIELPQDQTIGWTYDNSTHTVSFDAPIQIHNGGYYDIQGFTVGTRLTDQNGILISESKGTPTDILAGRTNLVNVRMAVDLNSIQPSVMRELAFNHTTLNVSLSVASYYMESLVNIHIGANRSMDWSPLIDNMQFDLQRLQIEKNGSAYNMLVPYSFDASNILLRQQANVRTFLRDSSGVLGNGSDIISMAEHNDGVMGMGITDAAAQKLAMNHDNLTVDVVIDFQGAEFAQSYPIPWEPLISDLYAGSPSISHGPPISAIVPFSFNASGMIAGKQMQVECILSNSTATISQGYGSINVGLHTEGQVSMPLSVPESSWFLRYSQDWTVTLRMTVMGINVEQSRSYHSSPTTGGP